MITSIYSLGKVTGAGMWVFGYFVCILIFVLICAMFKANRTRKGVVTLALSLIISEIICDTAWYLIFYSGGSYHNYGIRGAYSIFLWPVILLIAGLIGTRQNMSRKAS